jgi:hypothetical protein
VRETHVFSARVVPASYNLHARLNIMAVLFMNSPDRCSIYIRTFSRTAAASLFPGIGRVIVIPLLACRVKRVEKGRGTSLLLYLRGRELRRLSRSRFARPVQHFPCSNHMIGS